MKDHRRRAARRIALSGALPESHVSPLAGRRISFPTETNVRFAAPQAHRAEDRYLEALLTRRDEVIDWGCTPFGVVEQRRNTKGPLDLSGAALLLGKGGKVDDH